MFFIPIPTADLPKLLGDGVAVKIDSTPQVLRWRQGFLEWTDEEGLQRRPVVQAHEILIESKACVRFVCGDHEGDDLDDVTVFHA